MTDEHSALLNDSWRQPTISRHLVSDRPGTLFFVFLWLFTFVVFARPEDMFPALEPLHLTLVFGTCALLVWLGALVFGHMRPSWTSELQIVLLLTGWYIAGLPFSFWKSGSLQVLTDVWLKTVLMFFLLTQSLVTMKRIRKLLWAIFLSELLVMAFTILLPSKSIWIGERVYGVNVGILGWNFVGIAAAMTIPYMAALFVLRRSAISTTLLIATCLSMLWMLMLTASRGGFMSVVCSVILTWVLVLRGTPRGRFAGAAISMFLIACIALAPAIFWERMGTVWDDAGESRLTSGIEQQAAKESKEERLDLLTRSLTFTLEHPLFGLGLGNFELASGAQLFAQANAWMGTHNTYTQISSEGGIPALLLFLSLLVTAARNMMKISNVFRDTEHWELRVMSRATLAAILAFSFGAWFVHLAYGYYFFYIIAIACGLQHIAKTTTVHTAVRVSSYTPQLQPSF
jgi:O-antigen ligase